MNSAIYAGWVRHRRLRPSPHILRYRLFMMYLDLDELPAALDHRWLWSARRPAPAWFRRADFHGDPAVPLTEAVRSTIAARTGHAPRGPIRLLAHLRYFGYCFNPVAFYYCHDAAGRLETILAEITNTPWNERHAYVLPRSSAIDPGGRTLRFQFDKAFHVSPFMEMGLRYDWRFNEPGGRLGVHMENFDAQGKLFDATLSLERRELGGAALARALAAYPLMTLRIMGAIHWNALQIWLKGNPFIPHPSKGAS